MANEDMIARQLLQRRGAPASQENLRTAMMFVAQNPQVAEALSMGLQKTVDDTNQTMEPSFNLEAPPNVGGTSTPSAEVPSATSPQPTTPQRRASGSSTPPPKGAVARAGSGGNPTQSPFITTPLAKGGGEDDGGSLWPLLLAAAGIASRNVGQNRGATGTGAGPRGSFVGSMGVDPNTPRLTDQSTRVVADGTPRMLPSPMGGEMQLEAPETREQIGYDTTPRPRAGSVTVPTPQEPGQVAGPRPMSMFGPNVDIERSRAMANQMRGVLSRGGNDPRVQQALGPLIEMLTTGPSEGMLDISREIISAIQNLPHIKQIQIMNMLRGSELFSPEFTAMLQPRVGAPMSPGDILKSAVGRRGR